MTTVHDAVGNVVSLSEILRQAIANLQVLADALESAAQPSDALVKAIADYKRLSALFAQHISPNGGSIGQHVDPLMEEALAIIKANEGMGGQNVYVPGHGYVRIPLKRKA